MKSSKYNIFFNFQDKKIGYNTISDKFIILEPILYDLFEASLIEDVLHELPNVHESLFDILKDNGFIVLEKKDELEEIKQISNQTDFDESSYELTINPTMNCNFKCWYCYETHIKDSKMNDETLMNIVKYVDNILKVKKDSLTKFELKWFGGEPMLYFEKTVLPLLKKVYPKMVANEITFHSGFTTNGLLITQSILDECKQYGVKNFQITLDGHRERHNKVRYISKTRGSYDEIVRNIKLCLVNRFNVNARLNISEETLPDLLNIIEDFKEINNENKNYLTFSFHEVWQEEKNLTVDITNIVERYREVGFNCDYLGEQTATIKNSCYADKKNHATINYNGEVFKCTARDFESTSKEGDLLNNGNILWNDKYKTRIFDSRFSNPPCLECKILPICNGGCSQHRMENYGKEYCIYDYDEQSKLEVIKQKFYSRIEFKTPSNHLNNTINNLLSIDFNQFDKIEELTFQETLNQFFKSEIEGDQLSLVSSINNIYAEAIIDLRKNKFNSYKLQIKKAELLKSKLCLTKNGLKVISLFELPVLAYSEYKNKNYTEAINITNQSILNDDLFLEKHSFLYGHKLQQLHNTIRIYFKANDRFGALELCNKLLNHLLFLKDLDYPIGYWDPNYVNLLKDEIIGVIFQIFTETVEVINKLSKNLQEEYHLYQIAFNNLLFLERENILDPQLNLILDFLAIKKNKYLLNKFDEEFLKKNIEEICNSEFAYMCYPIFKSLFLSLGINSYAHNKAEFERVYS